MSAVNYDEENKSTVTECVRGIQKEAIEISSEVLSQEEVNVKARNKMGLILSVMKVSSQF